MKNRDIYLKDPSFQKLVNEGVANVNDDTTSEALAVLRYELETFVCDGQYEKGMEHILETYLRNIDQAQQPAVWISGFYGSGKSHLVKMLRALWVDTTFEDGATARCIASLPQDISDLFKELSTRKKRYGGLHAASGTLGSGASGSVRLALLRIILKSVGLPEQYHVARFVMWLKSEGIYEDVKNQVEQSGNDWLYELDNFIVAEDLHKALVQVKPQLFPSSEVCTETLNNLYRNVSDISNDEMLKTIKQAIIRDGKFPLTVIVLDEVQQYIGMDSRRSMDVQEAVEACCKSFGGKLLFIGTGQTAVTGTSNLKKLEGRFTIRVELSDADVDAVIRKVILAKKSDAISPLEKDMQVNIGEISRHLSGTTIGHNQDDVRFFAQDYPILPIRRRFWENTLRVLDPTGTDSQLRNQLSMIHKAIQTNLDAALGNVIEGDYIYFDSADKLLQTRILPRKVHEKTMSWIKGSEDRQLTARACGLVFLINKLAGKNDEIGIKATIDTVADLMVQYLSEGSSVLRSKLPGLMDKCELLMKVGDEYRIQTEESAAWNDEFLSQRSQLANEAHRVEAERDDRIRHKFGSMVKKITLTQGNSKVMRDFHLVFNSQLPPDSDKKICVWLRDGWSIDENSVRADALQAGNQSPTVYAFIPKRSADDLRYYLIDYKAASATLDKRGVPTGPEGIEARAAMETTRQIAEGKINELLDEAFSGTRVFQGGGNEILGNDLQEMALEYLRFVKAEDSKWIPAAGTFDGWPEKLAELKTLDPCCGSGHFLVAAFLMLVPMRMEREGLSALQAVDRVLSENIYGLELDQRCVELAAFALALTGWRYPGAGGYRPLPELNVACSGLAISAKKDEWLALAGDNTNLRIALEELYMQFKDSPVLGSLINPEASLGKDSLFELKWKDVGPLLTKALSGEKDDEIAEIGVVAKGVSRAATILSETYSLVITNVPYRSSNDLAPELNEFFKKSYSEASTAIETVFLLRCLQFCREGCTACLVLPHDWLFKTSYEGMRKKLLNEELWQFIAVLGPKAFQTPMWDFNVQLLIMSKGARNVSLNQAIRGVDVSLYRSAEKKSQKLIAESLQEVQQKQQLSNPDSRVVLETISSGVRLERYAKSVQGIKTGDDGRVRRNFWEIGFPNNDWAFYQSTFSKTQFFGGLEYVVYWGDEGNGLARRQGKRAWGTKGLAVSQMAALPSALYLGEKYDSNMTAIVPLKDEDCAALLAYGLSDELSSEVRKIDSSLKPTNGSFEKIPFDFNHWREVAQRRYPNGMPKPYSDDSTQWIFHGHPCGSAVWDEEKKWTAIGLLRTDAAVLQAAVARLLGYQWPAELDSAMELSDESRVWVKKSQKLLPFADEDGIVCIPPVRGEMKAEDRLENLLAAAYGSEWSSNKKAELLAHAGHAGKTLETWLRDKFFTQHCKLFHHRPFIWHIWDGLHDGFAALVNYHKLDAKLLETLIYTYLGDWISRQKQGIANGVDGAQEKLSAAEVLKKKLELILEGEAPHDIFVRWKNIEKQPIGWHPDLNDGVRLNIRPFLSVPDVGKKGAGILRDKPNIKWTKDRGKDVASAPWYHLGTIYGGNEGDRINDHHLTLDEKQKAREQIK